MPDSAKGSGGFSLTNRSPLEVSENYAKLRMNLFYTLVDKEQKISYYQLVSGGQFTTPPILPSPVR